jgi:hypothetical protein
MSTGISIATAQQELIATKDDAAKNSVKSRKWLRSSSSASFIAATA